MIALEARLRAASHILALLGFAGLIGLALMTTLDVLLRWLAGLPIQGVNDVSSLVMAVVISSCIPANLAMKQNIAMEAFGSVAGGRTRLALEAFASLITLAFIVLIAWQLVPYTMNLHANGERTWVLAWPVWPWWVAACALMIFSCVVQFAVLASDVAAVVLGDGGRQERDGESPVNDLHL